MKESPRNESIADGSVGARVRLVVRGGCLPVRGSERMTWKYDDCRCGCGLLETEMHVLFEWLCVCVVDVMDFVFPVCIVRCGAFDARVWEV